MYLTCLIAASNLKFFVVETWCAFRLSLFVVFFKWKSYMLCAWCIKLFHNQQKNCNWTDCDQKPLDHCTWLVLWPWKGCELGFYAYASSHQCVMLISFGLSVFFYWKNQSYAYASSDECVMLISFRQSVFLFSFYLKTHNFMHDASTFLHNLQRTDFLSLEVATKQIETKSLLIIVFFSYIYHEKDVSSNLRSMLPVSFAKRKRMAKMVITISYRFCLSRNICNCFNRSGFDWLVMGKIHQ